MTKEEEIQELKRLLYTDNITQYGKRKLIEYYENLIQTQQAEIEYLKQSGEKKDKIIDEMAKQLYIEGFCKELKCKKCTAKNFIICIKQYFERKINNENI